MGRAPCCDKANVKRGPWSPEEDATLKAYIDEHGPVGNWIALPQKIGLKRCGKSCRLRWLNYLRPNIKHGGFSDEEDNIICSLYITIGSRWSIIAGQLPGRTDNDIKNYWNTKLKKKIWGKQRKDQRARPTRYLKQEIKRKIEDGLLITDPINTDYPQIHAIEGVNLKINQTINYELTNNHYFHYPSQISCVQDHQMFENPIPMHGSSFSTDIKNASSTSSASPYNWVGVNSLIQGYNSTNLPQIDEIAYNNPQNFDGFETTFSGVDMVNSSTITTTSPESASWEDISSLVYPPPPSASNLQVCQQLIMPNYTGYNNYMVLQ